MGSRSADFASQKTDQDERTSVVFDDNLPKYTNSFSRFREKSFDFSFKPKTRGSFVNDSLSKKILLIQDILYELPEIETNLVNTISGVKHKPKKSILVKLIRLLFVLVFILLIYSCIFVIGLIVSSYLLSPIPLTGSIMTSYIDPKVENNLQKILIIPPTTDSNTVKVRGTFKVSFNVYNNSPFSGALSLYMDVSYLPQSGTVSNFEKCFGNSAYKYVYKYNYSNIFNEPLNFFRNTSYNYKNISSKDDDLWTKKRSGSLITLEKVLKESEIDDKRLVVIETKAYNAFSSIHLAGNKIQIIPKIRRGINKVVILVTLETEFDNEKESAIANRILSDCKKNGSLALKFNSSLQRFETMLFSGNMLPTSFLPVLVPCHGEYDSQLMDKVVEMAGNQRVLYNRQQYILKKLNTSLNM